MQTERTWTARLQAELPLAPAVRHLTFQVEGPKPFHWQPGQYLELFAEAAPHLRYPYSLASAERPLAPGLFELAVRRDGSAHAVEQLRVGNVISVGEPRGNFVRNGDRNLPAVFIAMGTGVAPLRAMIQSALSHGGTTELVLLFGCRSEEELLWGPELEGLAKHPRFEFLPTLSRPAPSWTGRTGYVQAHLEDLHEWLEEAEVFVCGSRKMVSDVRKRLQARGIPTTRLWLEGY